MSEHDETLTHGDHDHHDVGAHEVDKMPSSRLFNLLFGLSALTLVACIGVVQLFYRQVDSIRDTRDTKVSFQLAEYRQEMDELKSGWTVVELTDDDGVPLAEGGKGVHEERRTMMPLSEARKRVLEEPAKHLKAERPYRGWRNPDPNAPKAGAVPAGVRPLGRQLPGRRPAPGAGAPGRQVIELPVRPEGVEVPAKGEAQAPAEGKAPARDEAAVEGKAPAKDEAAEGKAPAKGEGKAPAKGEGKAAPAKGEGKGSKAPAKGEGKAAPAKGEGKAAPAKDDAKAP